MTDYTWPTDRNRPECASLIAADPRVPSLPQGNCIVSMRDGQLWIDRADPRLVIGFQLLDEIVCGRTLPEVTIRHLDNATPSWKGSVIRIEAVNRTVLYRLEECLDWYCGWIAEWPD